MPLVDATLTSTPSVALLFFADFADLPLRGAFAPCPIYVPTVLADVDDDCRGQTFPVLDSKVLEVGVISQEDGGDDTLAFALQADPSDTALMSAIENPALYAGRKVRVWFAVYNPAVVTNGGATVTELKPVKRCYMTQPSQEADGSRYVITMIGENFAALMSAAQFRTYMQSMLYDAGDQAGAVIKGMSGAIPGAAGGGVITPQFLLGPVYPQ